MRNDSRWREGEIQKKLKCVVSVTKSLYCQNNVYIICPLNIALGEMQCMLPMNAHDKQEDHVLK